MILQSGTETVLAIPDMQCPFEHEDTVPFLKAVAKKVKPTKVVCIGDSLDCHAMSRWQVDPDGYSAREEYERGIRSMKRIYKLFPEAVEVISNHNERIAKRAFGAGIPQGFLKSYREIMQYPEGWRIERDVEIDGVMYEHGHSQGGVHAAYNLAIHNGQSTVIGHHHSHAGIHFIANRRKMIWGMNVGCLIDVEAYAFAYAREAKFKPTLGCGVVVKGVPYFIPMLLDGAKRWTGQLFLP